MILLEFVQTTHVTLIWKSLCIPQDFVRKQSIQSNLAICRELKERAMHKMYVLRPIMLYNKPPHTLWYNVIGVYYAHGFCGLRIRQAQKEWHHSLHDAYSFSWEDSKLGVDLRAGIRFIWRHLPSCVYRLGWHCWMKHIYMVIPCGLVGLLHHACWRAVGCFIGCPGAPSRTEEERPCMR